MEKEYRLKINYKNYRKGNVIKVDESIDEGVNMYNNRNYAQFKKCPLWSFSETYMLVHPEIFEEIKKAAR